MIVVIPGPLRELAGDRGELRIDGAARSVGEVLGLVWEQCPALRDRIVTERGEVRPHVNVFVDGESIRFSAGLATPVHPRSEIVILPAVSGG